MAGGALACIDHLDADSGEVIEGESINGIGEAMECCKFE
jgi:hypothetical protein